jgi:hypothetical protein
MSARPWYATNARDLLETRRQGFRPERPVHVSLMGPVFDELTLYVHDDMPLDRLDWRMLVNVEVVVLAQSSVAFDRIVTVLKGIAKAQPSEMQLCWLHRDEWHLIDCGTGTHSPRMTFDALPDVDPVEALHDFFWRPINLGATATGYRLKAALHKSIPPGTHL